MFRRFGSDVTIIEMRSRLIEREDEDVSAAIKDILEAEGINIRLNAKCIALSQNGQCLSGPRRVRCGFSRNRRLALADGCGPQAQYR